jgi:hypothetical protein
MRSAARRESTLAHLIRFPLQNRVAVDGDATVELLGGLHAVLGLLHQVPGFMGQVSILTGSEMDVAALGVRVVVEPGGLAEL